MLYVRLAAHVSNGEISQELSALLQSQTDPDMLEKWFSIALKAKRLDEFTQNIE